MDDPEAWRIVWLVAAVAFAAGEMLSPGALFLLPFAVGAGAAALLAYLDVELVWQWAGFLAISILAFAALRPLAHRLERSMPHTPVGAERLVGQKAVVTKKIPGDGVELGQVRVLREEWRAASWDGREIDEGTAVTILKVRGAHAVVWPAHLPLPEDAPQPGASSS